MAAQRSVAMAPAAVAANPRRPLAEIRSWGGNRAHVEERLGEDLAHLSRDVPLCRGLGRAYGDAALPPAERPRVAGSRLADRILDFDVETGVLRAEAGLPLGTVNRVFWPRCFSAPVMPGTQFVTLGGMVAADVHGKNHHRDGSFGRHVRRLVVRVFDDGSPHGRIVTASREENPQLFRATLGGMGLTGHVLEVEVALARLESPWILAEQRRHADLESLLAGLESAAADWPFTVAWADCLAKRVPGVLIAGRWATRQEAPAAPPPAKRRLSVPVDAPSWLLNRATIRAFNAAYGWRSRFGGRAVTHPESFFHPLDAVGGWNRIYGRRGFTQYQCVLPAAAGRGAVRAFFEQVRIGGGASFLTVVKDFGAEGEGVLSFPRPGTTISLDLPINRRIQALVDRLNAFVVETGGRIYLAKDALTRQQDFRRLEPRLDDFLALRQRFDPTGRLGSRLASRLMGDSP